MIRRGPRPSDQFAQIHNSALGDLTITNKARGLLVYLLSRPPGWTTSAEKLAAMMVDGRDGIKVQLTELEKAGYLVRTRSHGPDGKWVHDMEVTDQKAATVDGFSVDGKTTGGKAVDINNTDSNNTPPSSSSSSPSITHEDDELSFQQFCAAYPKVERPVVLRAAWATAITKASPQVIIGAAQGYARLCQQEGRDVQYVSSAISWLREERWNDKYPAAPGTTGKGWSKVVGD